MATATWDDTGLRLYHAGVDRGMLYAGGDIPLSVPWNGLVSVTENPSGGDLQPYYLDGRKIFNVAAGEDFAATIVSFAAPFEFAPCAGRLRLSTGLYATEQPKVPFGFSYRTMIGNDSAGIGFAYKVHVVYNAIAQIADFTHTTDSASSTAAPYSWNVTTCPVVSPGVRPTSHIVLDSRRMTAGALAGAEVILYGNDTDDPRLPDISELVALLGT